MHDVARPSADIPVFLAGGGEMGALMRAHDWAATPLGPPETWPQPLRTAIRFILNTGHPMYVWWGPELLCFYNDAYRASIGPERHPSSLGQPGREVWAEIWPIIGPQIEQVMAGGGPTWQENALVPITRHGRREDVYWTYSYGPIDDEEAPTGVGGVLVVCTETTEQVLAAQRALDDRERLARMFEQAPGFMAMLEGPDHRFTLANPAYLRLIGQPDVVGRSAAEALPEVVEQGFIDLLDRVYGTGESFVGQAQPIMLQREPDGPSEERFVDFVYQPVSDAEGQVTGIFVEGSDVTERKQAEAALAEREFELRTLTDALPVLVSYIDAERRYRFNNKIYETWFPRRREDIVGKLVREVVGEAAYAKAAPHMDAALRGERVTFDQFMPYADAPGRHIEVEYIPRQAPDGSIEGFYTLVQDVTARKTAEEALRKSEELLRLATDAADVGLWDFDAQTEELFWQPRVKALFGISADKPVSIADFYDGVHPEDRQATLEAFAAAQDPERRAHYNVEYRTIGAEDGVIRWVAAKGRGVFDDKGRCLRVLGTTLDITARKAAEDRLRELNETLESQVAERTAERDRMWRLSTDIMLVARFDGMITAINPAWGRLLGWADKELLGEVFFDFVHPDDLEATLAEAGKLSEGATTFRFDNRHRAKDGSYRWISWIAVPEDGLIHAVGRDISAEKERQAELEQAQEALRQSQKMEAVGQLTGGLAHDFNNLLTGITGSLDLMATRITQGRLGDVERYMVAAQGAARRAAALTHRLLAFSRRQTLAPKVTDVNTLVAGMADLIRRTVGPQVAVECVTASGVWPVEVDPNQLENALLNLAINARDAMPEGGQITIETANRWMDARGAREQELSPGQYVSLSVSDTGTGMSAEVAARAFDPFFTTKPLGVGTGLGLSMVYGFARQSGGQVRIYSEVGQGTTVCLYLPRHLGEVDGTEVNESGVPAAGPAQAGEVVLVIDDEPVVRMLVVDVLEELGYTALEASDGSEGLKVLQSKARVDLLITDVGLPGGLNGRQVADAARVLRPELKVLYITGYAENAVISQGRLETGMYVMTKPFQVEELGRRIRTILSDE